jgi:hypothetical protein
MKKNILKLLLPLLLVMGSLAIAQVYWNTNFGNALTGTEYIGSNNAFPLNFYTNNTLQMSLTTSGSLNIVNNTTQGYMLGGGLCLANYGNTSNIFVGVGAGMAHIGNGGFQNTYLGVNSGRNNRGANNNTLLGFSSGFSLGLLNTSDDENTLVGVLEDLWRPIA